MQLGIITLSTSGNIKGTTTKQSYVYYAGIL